MDGNNNSELYDKDVDLCDFIGKDADAEHTVKFNKDGEAHLQKHPGLYIKVKFCITSAAPDPSLSRY
jgi:hypothetical protein